MKNESNLELEIKVHREGSLEEMMDVNCRTAEPNRSPGRWMDIQKCSYLCLCWHGILQKQGLCHGANTHTHTHAQVVEPLKECGMGWWSNCKCGCHLPAMWGAHSQVTCVQYNQTTASPLAVPNYLTVAPPNHKHTEKGNSQKSSLSWLRQHVAKLPETLVVAKTRRWETHREPCNNGTP